MWRLAYKLMALGLIAYSLVGGLISEVPRLPVLHESIRMLYVHVPMWFGMVLLYSMSAYYAAAYIRGGQSRQEHLSYAYAYAGFWYGMLGLITGMLWARYTWGAAWSHDPKQNAAAMSMLIYLAYFILRRSVPDAKRGARMAAVYNLFGFGVMVPLLFVLPRLTDSLHPGSGGNPGFNTYDLNSKMRVIFYPAVLGWIMLGIWLARLHAKTLDIAKQLARA